MDPKAVKLNVLKNAIVMLLGGYLQGDMLEEVDTIPGILRDIANDYEQEIYKARSEQ